MRRLFPLIAALLGFVILAIAWIASDRRASQRIYDDYSIANTSPSGLSLAAGYLGRQRSVSMLTRRLGREPLERDAVVFRVTGELPLWFDPEDLDDDTAGPPRPRRSPLMSDEVEAWVRGGGRLVIAVREGALDTASVDAQIARKVFPIWPAVGDLDLSCEGCAPRQGLAAVHPRMHALFATDARVVLARERIGDGELFVLSTPELLQNARIGDANNLALLDALAAGRERPVYFDEMLHGIVSGDGALALMKDWNLGPFLLLASAATVLVFWRRGRRVGPPEDDYRETRSDAVDLVRSLGALYGETTSDANAIALYHDALTRSVALSTGLRGEALRKRVEELTGGLVPPPRYEDLPRATFRRMLGQVNRGFEKLPQTTERLPGGRHRRRATPAGRPAGTPAFRTDRGPAAR